MKSSFHRNQKSTPLLVSSLPPLLNPSPEEKLEFEPLIDVNIKRSAICTKPPREEKQPATFKGEPMCSKEVLSKKGQVLF